MNAFEQSLLNYLSPNQLQKIQKQKIGIGGAGGLGSNVAMILIRCGFRYLEIIDHDTVETSNLNRQQYILADVGKAKVEVLKQHLKEINPDIVVLTHQQKWSMTVAKEVFNDCSIVVESFDQAADKHAFVSYYQSQVLYLISASGMAGLRQQESLPVKKIDNIFIVGDQRNDIKEGHPPLAPRVMACAAKMAGIVFDLVLQNEV